MKKLLILLTVLLVCIAALTACAEEPQNDGATQGPRYAGIIISDYVNGGQLANTRVELAEDETTVLDLLEKVCAENSLTLEAEGGFVTRVGDIEQDTANNLSWIYYVNDEMPYVGMDEYQLANEDIVELAFCDYTTIEW